MELVPCSFDSEKQLGCDVGGAGWSYSGDLFSLLFAVKKSPIVFQITEKHVPSCWPS